MSNFETRAADASAAGFIYQLERALLHLATSRRADARVGVETDDDVAGPGFREQDKLSLQSQGHPFQDRSVNLWKTLAIWVAEMRANTSALDATEFHLVTNRPVPTGALARTLAVPAKSEADVDACIARLISVGTDPSESIRRYVDIVLDVTDRSNLRAVIHRIRLADAAAGGTTEDVAQSAVGALHLPPECHHPEVLNSLRGWLLETLMTKWKDGQPGWIGRTEFDRQLNAIVRRQVHVQRQERAARLLSIDPGEREEKRILLFVGRLVEVEADGEEIDQAIDDYIRHTAEAIRLSSEGDYTVDDWEDFYGELHDRWKKVATKVRRAARVSGLLPEIEGYQAFSETIYCDFRGSLGGQRTVQSYLTSGGYHKLVQHTRVWWHPQHASSMDKK